MPQFSSSQPLREIVAAQKRGETAGIYAICSAHPLVIEACLLQAKAGGTPALIEATCNQVNQFGGYTGMTPAAFARYVAEIAQKVDFPTEKIILGGDHLGIHPWQAEAIETAMEKAREMVREFIRAGFSKIHLDASMSAASDDPGCGLDSVIVAERAADLCAVAEEAGAVKPVYVIGTEVPPPGGARIGHDELTVTSPADARETLKIFAQAFHARGLDSAWERVIALVVQPGVEFGQASIHDYDREAAQPLSTLIQEIPGLVYEAHSTDYQRPAALRALVEDHFAILKVGPELTFAFREAVFALAEIESAWIPSKGIPTSNLVEVIEQVMCADPRHWAKYYPGTAEEQAFARKFSLSDRIRYYWPRPEIQQALTVLQDNLARFPPPLALLSQYLPKEYEQVRDGNLPNHPRALILAHIRQVAQKYAAVLKVS